MEKPGEKKKMETIPLKKQKHNVVNPEGLNFSEKTWLISIFTAAWIILTPIIFSTLPRMIVKDLISDKSSNDTRIKGGKLIETEKSEDKEADSDVWFLSTKNQEAAGKLTEEKGFEAKTHYDKLRIAKAGDRDKSSGKKLIETLSVKEAERVNLTSDTRFHVQIVEEDQIQGKGVGVSKMGNSTVTTIPENYNFRDKFAFSWSKDGAPQIPTAFMEHYDYFQNMFRKIMYNWYPPGGQFRERFEYSRNVPGTSSYTPFPEQDVWIVFMIDAKGNFVDAKVYKSLGYNELNSSLLDAFKRAKNFGPPPKELLEKGNLILGVIWRYF
ncbi:MAG: energy transducer TonB [Leptospirales bacterium]